jgi:predicted Zn-dependent protease
VARARAASNAGDLPAAVRSLDAARTRAPGDVVAWVATLEVLGEWRDPRALAMADDAIARFPDDRRVTVAATSALHALGHADRAATLLREAWAAHTGDADLAAAAEALDVDLARTGALRGMSPAP